VCRVELERVGPAAAHGLGQLGKGPLEERRRLQEAPRAGVALPEEVEQHAPGAGVPPDRRVAEGAQPVEEGRAGAGAAAQLDGRRQADPQGVGRRRAGATLGAQVDHAAGHREPSAGGRGGDGDRKPGGLDPAEPPLQQGRRDQRGRQHDQQHRPVQVGAQDALAQAQAGEDQADLAAGEHAEADQQPVAATPRRAEPGGQLADDADGEQGGGEAEHLGADEAGDVSVDADLEEEDGHEQVAHRRQLGADALRLGGPRQREPGHERADDRRQPGRAGKLGESQREGQGEGHERARRPGQPVHDPEQGRRQAGAHAGGHDQEGDGQAGHRRHRAGRDGPVGHEPHDDGEDDEPHHVVGHRRAEHGAGLDAGQGAEVPEHPGGDPHGRGGEGGAHEDGRARRLASGGRHRPPGDEGQGDAEHRHLERCPAHGPELPEVHLEPDLEEEQDDAELAEGVEDLARLHQAEGRRPECEPGEDLPHDGRQAHPLGALGRHLGGHEDEEDVEEDAVHAGGRVTSARPGRARITRSSGTPGTVRQRYDGFVFRPLRVSYANLTPV
jgi:hypothetical protein